MEKPEIISRKSKEGIHQIVINYQGSKTNKINELFSTYGIEEIEPDEQGNYNFELQSGINLNKLIGDAFFGKLGGYNVVRALRDPDLFPEEANQYPVLNEETEPSYVEQPNIEEQETITQENIEEKSNLESTINGQVEGTKEKQNNYLKLIKNTLGTLLIAGAIATNVYFMNKAYDKIEDLKQTNNYLQQTVSELANSSNETTEELNNKLIYLKTELADFKDSNNTALRNLSQQQTNDLNSLSENLEGYRQTITNKLDSLGQSTDEALLILGNEFMQYEENEVVNNDLLKTEINNLDEKLEDVNQDLSTQIEGLDEKKGTSLWWRIKNIF